MVMSGTLDRHDLSLFAEVFFRVLPQTKKALTDFSVSA